METAAGRVMAQAGLTARRTGRADAKAEHSEPAARIRCGQRLTDKSYSGDNRLVLPKSPYRRQGSAPRCRLNLSWGWRRSQGFGCSPIKKLRELGSDRLEAKKFWLLNRLNPRKRHFTAASGGNVGMRIGYIGEKLTCQNNLSYVRIIPREVEYDFVATKSISCRIS